MKLSRRTKVAGVAVVVVAALAVGGAGLAKAVGGDSDEPVTGSAAEKARSAALGAAGGGTVLEVERQDGDGAGAYEVEVRRTDGSTVEIHLDAGFRPVGTAPDDDESGASDEGDGNSDGS
jgi:uncharacterized membrane protein YkoI